MNQGRIEQIGPPPEIYRKPHTAFVADFIGSTNFVEGMVRGIDGNTVALDVLGQTLTIPKSESPLEVGKSARLVVRPEAIQVVEQGGQFQGVIRWASYLGSLVEYQVEVAGQQFLVTDTDPRHTVIFSQGHEVGVRLLEDCIYVLPE
jgi:ABC-type Fe3+/spermidine/putrescine transport system ATPase subunit